MAINPVGSLQAFSQKRQREAVEAKQAETIKGFTALGQFEDLAKSTPASRTANIAFGGGFLSPEIFSRAKFLQKEGLVTEFETAQAEAKAANEQRYADILQQYGTTIEGAAARGPEVLTFDESQFAGLGDQAKDRKSVV